MRVRTNVAFFALLIGAVDCSSDFQETGTSTVASPFSVGGDTAQEKAFTAFESGQVRPLALSPDGKLLFAVNTPDNRLNLPCQRARLTPGVGPRGPRAGGGGGAQRRRGLGGQPPLRQRQHRRRSTRGRRRRASCARCSSATSRATSCSPGPGGARAFITTAHRGQNIAVDPQLTTPGVGRADVWVFDADNLGDSLGRHAAHDHHALHRHAARAGGDARREHASTPPASTPATSTTTVTERARHARRRPARRRRTTNCQGIPAAARPA